ncbi:hypothetical protein ACFPM0_03160 [Pseudonocardia sulfidoxydans]
MRRHDRRARSDDRSGDARAGPSALPGPRREGHAVTRCPLGPEPDENGGQ